MADRHDHDRDDNRARDDDNRDRNRGRNNDRYEGGRGEDRGFVQRAGDEVRSWFGDDEAERRRQRDEFRDGRSEAGHNRQGYGRESFERDRMTGYGRERGFGAPDSGVESSRAYGAGFEPGSSRFGADRGTVTGYGYGAGGGERGFGSGDYNRVERSRSHGEFDGQAQSYGAPQGGQRWGQYAPQHTQYAQHDQQTMGNPDVDRTSSIYGNQQQGWGPQARGHQGENWSSDRGGYGSSSRSSAASEDWASQHGDRFESGSRRHGSSFDWSSAGPHSGRGPRGYQRSDDRIREDICEQLTRHGRIDATDITITVVRGEVTLDGTVDSREGKRLAEDVAESVSGVRDVTNHLKTQGGHRSDDRDNRSRENPNSPSNAGLGNPGTPSTLGLSGTGANIASTEGGPAGGASSTSGSDKKR